MSWRVRLREKWTGLAPRVQPTLKARVGLADVVQRGGTLDHFQQIVGQADPLRHRPGPCPGRVTMPVEVHGDGTQRQLVELVAQGLGGGPLDRQAWHFVARFENGGPQPANESGPLAFLPSRRCRGVREGRKDVRDRFGPFRLVDLAVLVGDPQCRVDESTELRTAQSPDRDGVEGQPQVGERGVHDGFRSDGVPSEPVDVSRVARDDDPVSGTQVVGGDLLDGDTVPCQSADGVDLQDLPRLRQRHVDGLAIRAPRP